VDGRERSRTHIPCAEGRSFLWPAGERGIPPPAVSPEVRGPGTTAGVDPAMKGVSHPSSSSSSRGALTGLQPPPGRRTTVRGSGA